VAHNVSLGTNVVVIANSMLGGSAIVESGAWLAPSSSVLNQLTIGANSIVGLGAVVIKSVEENTVVAGNPAKMLRIIGEKS
jgi:acetyltransferase-like isoleucine patch superfamily enzyme